MRTPLLAALTVALASLVPVLAQTAVPPTGPFPGQPAPPTPRPLPAPEPPASATVTRLEPVALGFTPDKLARLKVPAGFTVSVMATDLGNARMLHVMPDGGVYLSRRKQNDIWYLKDVNRDGRFDAGERRQVASQLSMVHGMDVRQAVRGGRKNHLGDGHRP